MAGRVSKKQAAAGERAESAAEMAARAIAMLEAKSSAKIRDEMAPRYGIVAKKAFGVSVSNIQSIAKKLGKSHELAAALWKTGWYEARMLAVFVEEPERVSAAQMDRSAKEFDNWGICDTACFKLFDQTPERWGRVAPWCGKRDEFVKRAGFALIACLAAHDKGAQDEQFRECLPLIRKGAEDDRNFVKKGVSWALRMMGRRNRAINRAALKLAEALAASESASAKWIGRGAVKELAGRW